MYHDAPLNILVQEILDYWRRNGAPDKSLADARGFISELGGTPNALRATGCRGVRGPLALSNLRGARGGLVASDWAGRDVDVAQDMLDGGDCFVSDVRGSLDDLHAALRRRWPPVDACEPPPPLPPWSADIEDFFHAEILKARAADTACTAADTARWEAEGCKEGHKPDPKQAHKEEDFVLNRYYDRIAREQFASAVRAERQSPYEWLCDEARRSRDGRVRRDYEYVIAPCMRATGSTKEKVLAAYRKLPPDMRHQRGRKGQGKNGKKSTAV
jgi:hypothetical protein